MNLKVALLYSLLFISSNAYSASEMFSCNMGSDFNINLIFTASNNKAELILNTSHVNGSVTVNEHHYYFKFHKTNERYETHAIINRYTGKLTWEIGTPPFGASSSKNIHDTGICRKSEVKKAL